MAEITSEVFSSAPAGSESYPTDSCASPNCLSGVSVFSGIALGQAHIVGEGELEVPHFPIDKTQTRAEFTRLRAAIATVDKELVDMINGQAISEAPSEALAFLNLQLQILHDESLISDTQDIIKERLVNAEWAMSLRLEDLRKAFDAIDDNYLAERVEDIAQVIERVQRVLAGRRRLADSVSQPMSDNQIVLVAHNLNPVDILILKRRRDVSIVGLVIETGSATSHTAILARSLEIPTLMSVAQATEKIKNDDVVLIDSDRNLVTINPVPSFLPEIAQHIKVLNETHVRQTRLRATKAKTKDNVSISLLANIALPEDVLDAVRMGADGIGLYRSEFLFMHRPTLPCEDEQYEAYLRVIRAMRGKPVTIRTMDLGGDKSITSEALESLGMSEEDSTNPSLGRRAIRFCLTRPDFFITQLRAILRAAASGNVRIMIPMLSRPSEIDLTRCFLRKAREDLIERKVSFADKIACGGMIEVPAAALALPSFLKKLDFVSLGTNDLIQYILAVDRHDPAVSELYDPLHPAVLRLLSSTIKTALRAKKEISVCGEIAGDPLFAELLIGMGLRTLSMESARILPLKERILDLDSRTTATLVSRLLRMHDPVRIHKAANSTNPCRLYESMRNLYQ